MSLLWGYRHRGPLCLMLSIYGFHLFLVLLGHWLGLQSWLRYSNCWVWCNCSVFLLDVLIACMKELSCYWLRGESGYQVCVISIVLLCWWWRFIWSIYFVFCFSMIKLYCCIVSVGFSDICRWGLRIVKGRYFPIEIYVHFGNTIRSLWLLLIFLY